MAFLSSIGNAAGSLFGTSSASAAAGAAGAGAGSGLSGAAGASLTPAAMASSMGYGAPVAAGSSSILESLPMGMGGGMGLFKDFKPEQALGMVGAMLGNEAKGGSAPGQLPNTQMANFPQVVQQALGEKPWAANMYDTYIKQLISGG